ncbi:MAG: amidohydrolase family protein [Egibacteraceae bacterium]
MRAVDFHVHPTTPDWLDGSMAGYIEPAEKYFRAPVIRADLRELADRYRALDAKAVLLAWNASTAMHRPPVSNERIAAACAKDADVFVGFGCVDPHTGRDAVDGIRRIADLGLRGVKLHPSLQAFAPDDEQYWPIFAQCERLGLPVLFHTGTSGIGAGQPGGQGIRLDYARPIRLDSVAAAHPALQIVAAHFGWPWHHELIAMALHKTNIHIEISGWSPRRIPPDVVHEMGGRLRDRFIWGSDTPFISPERSLAEMNDLGLSPTALTGILHGNAMRLLGLDSSR